MDTIFTFISSWILIPFIYLFFTLIIVSRINYEQDGWKTFAGSFFGVCLSVLLLYLKHTYDGLFIFDNTATFSFWLAILNVVLGMLFCLLVGFIAMRDSLNPFFNVISLIFCIVTGYFYYTQTNIHSYWSDYFAFFALGCFLAIPILRRKKPYSTGYMILPVADDESPIKITGGIRKNLRDDYDGNHHEKLHGDSSTDPPPPPPKGK